MIPLDRIVFGSDFSEVSERALGRVVEFARSLGASVDIVHVYALTAFTLPIEGAVISTPAYLAKLTDHLQQQLDALVARHAGAVDVRGHLIAGTAHEELVRVAGELDAGLIAVGTHGRTGAAHAFLGSVAERIIRRADRPVLTVRP